MRFKNNTPETHLADELSDMSPVSDDKLDSISGGGSPWDNIKGVPLQSIDEELWKRNTVLPNDEAKAR